MNPILKKLQDQSGLQPYYNDQQVHIENFVKLVITECALVANRAENDDMETRPMYEVVLAHFGIKT